MAEKRKVVKGMTPLMRKRPILLGLLVLLGVVFVGIILSLKVGPKFGIGEEETPPGRQSVESVNKERKESLVRKLPIDTGEEVKFNKVANVSKVAMSSPKLIKDLDFEKPGLPKDLENKAKNVDVKEMTVDVLGVNVFCQGANEAGGTSGKSLLLLHGMKFSSQTWRDPPMSTIQTMAALGHKVLACDLPGYKKTPQANVDRVQFLSDLIDKAKLGAPVIVSPSMSGGYSIPFLLQRSDKISGFMPVAPVSTEGHEEEYAKIKTPTVIVYGDQDTSLGLSSYNNLKGLANTKTYVLKKAGHPAYLDQPAYFHTLLHNFLTQI